LVEHAIENRSVASSILAPGTIIFNDVANGPQERLFRCANFLCPSMQKTTPHQKFWLALFQSADTFGSLRQPG
jgi:hypothetical protein